MADKTRYDLDMIKDCSDSLYRIHREFKENGNPADGYGDDLGSDKLRDVFDDFSETWKKNRKKLMKDIENLAKYTDNAAKAYEDIDHELAQALRDAKKSDKKGK
ncbi:MULTISPECIES: hypothetical protein [unclassified Streptomyces]|uniref:hypothetical protein n=1 Tax=unclassified Streptomyces TaxID=2593676 RepID=UPI00224FA6F5|nr:MULTISPECIES: hypothetical protein [unclassified Streptomyces]WTB39136.1 hypothetical protein OG569_14660 [Streptomyces sp. NBC_00827]WUC13208.1 hypothetical protein OG256_26570 [Streptomyces sp. NBC_00564]WUC50284.1 hypothetical protein OG266_18455 [Streptomyces sp. NBC_00554]MCX4972307.1 hypothetical protein [Streptomyces sp. NBC_00620]WRZ20567.1 hypothetical protein OHT59_19700 [Streptomyces sp. NBC_00243]